MMMDTTVIHYNYRIRIWKWVHAIESPSNKISELHVGERPLDNINIEDAVQREGWKN